MATNNQFILDQLAKAREKKPPKPKKSIKKVSEKKKKEIEENKLLLEADAVFYKECWLASPHFCWNCGLSLGKSPYNWMFHHLLPKRDYPQFRHTFENICILCLECHSKAETNINFAPKIKERRILAEKTLLNL